MGSRQTQRAATGLLPGTGDHDLPDLFDDSDAADRARARDDEDGDPADGDAGGVPAMDAGDEFLFAGD
jgi:hypothetical protein